MARGKKAAKELTPEEKLKQALVPAEEQPYPIPENWRWCRISSVCDFERGITFPASAKEHEATATNIPCVRTANVQDELEIDDLLYVDISYMKNNEAKYVHPDDIIMSSANSRELVGKVSYVYGVPFPMTFGGFVLAIRVKSIYSKYLFYYLRFEFLSGKFMGESTQTTNIANINTTKLGNYEFPLSPLTEQRRIVDRIESLFAKLDEAKEKAQAVIDGFELRKSTILRKAFMGELTAGWRKENGVGLDSWTERKLKDCGDWCGGGTPSTAHPEYWDGGDLLWITSKDMKSDVIEDTLMHINMAGVENSSANYVEKPSVLFVVRSGILRRTLPIAMVKIPFTVNQDLKVISPVDDLDLEYFFWVCKSAEKSMLSTCMKNGTTVESINVKALMEFEVPIASQPEQREIVNCVVSLLNKEQQAKEAAEAVLTQLDIIKKSILARAFRGELGTNNPAEESAEDLIVRCLDQSAK